MSPNKTVEAILLLLQETYPKTFFLHERKRLPLKVGITQDLERELAGAITPQELRKAIAIYVANAFYLKLCSRVGAARFDLSGAECGSVSDEQATYAVTTLMFRKIEVIGALHRRDRKAALASLGLTEKEVTP